MGKHKKTLKLIVLAALALLFSRCKTTVPTGPSGSEPSLLEVQQILDTTAAIFLQYADSTNGDPSKALMQTANWVQSLPNVQSVSTLDSAYLDIVLKSGLQTGFFFNPVDDSGHAVFRGGGGHSEKAHINFSGLSKNTITNKKVLIYAPAWTEFNLQSTVPKTVRTLSNPGLGLDVTVLKDEDCTPVIANTFKDYGLVILDTHGFPDAFMSGTIIDIAKSNNTAAQYKAAVIFQVGQDIYDGLINKDYRAVSTLFITSSVPNWQKRQNLKRIECVYVNTQYVQKLPAMPNSVVFGNMCYSGFSVADPTRNIVYPIRTAFMDKNPISYYGFVLANGRSTPVTDPFSKDMEDSLTKRLVNDRDSTGRAHLRPADGAEFFDTYLMQEPGYRNITLLFKHFGADDYSYVGCGDTLLDTRDGQKYATVCIGGKSWMAQNLNYNAPGSLVYNNDPANGKIYGRLYDYATLMQGADSTSKNPSGVQGVCPNGWHVPSLAEYVAIVSPLGGSALGGGAMKAVSSLWNAPNGSATNSTGFSGLPGGYALESPPTFTNLGAEADFGTTNRVKSNHSVWLLESTDGGSGSTGVLQNTAVSCRCVKD